MKYRVTIRGQKGDYQREIECDEIRFEGSWWATFIRFLDPEYPDTYVPVERRRPRRVQIVAAVPAENVNLIEKIEEK